MKEQSIIFRAEMVRAILDGRKTMTRRPIKPQPQLANDGQWDWYVKKKWVGAINKKNNSILNRCPFGQPGDHLWVKETWAEIVYDCTLIYKADCDAQGLSAFSQLGEKWKSSRFMPRWASRIILVIMNIRVEKLQDITRKDAILEGCKGGFPEDRFVEFWNSIYGKDSWYQNPWVWVIGFAYQKSKESPRRV